MWLDMLMSYLGGMAAVLTVNSHRAGERTFSVLCGLYSGFTFGLIIRAALS